MLGVFFGLGGRKLSLKLLKETGSFENDTNNLVNEGYKNTIFLLIQGGADGSSVDT